MLETKMNLYSFRDGLLKALFCVMLLLGGNTLIGGCVSTKTAGNGDVLFSSTMTAEIGDGLKVEYKKGEKPAPRPDGKVYFLGALPEDRYTKEVLESLPKDIIDQNSYSLSESQYKDTIDKLKEHDRFIVMYWDNAQSVLAKQQAKNFWTDLKYHYGDQAKFFVLDCTVWSNRLEKARNDLGKDLFPGWIVYGNPNGSVTRLRGSPKYDDGAESWRHLIFFDKDSGMTRRP